jgi:membrane protease YdiL (CAAX protease family)
MRLPRTIPVVLLLSAIMYVPVVVFRNVLSGMDWEAKIGLPQAAVDRILFYAVLASLAIIVMALCKDISWREFGFRRADGNWKALAGIAVLLGMLSTLIIKASGGSGLDASMAGISPVELLIIAFVATCVEELFVRGWIQGFLSPLQQVRVGILGKTVSAPVLTGALAFGAMHLSLLFKSLDAVTVACVLAFTTLLGLLAGLSRERTGSLTSGIGTHLAGNVGGIMGGILYAIATGSVAPT